MPKPDLEKFLGAWQHPYKRSVKIGGNIEELRKGSYKYNWMVFSAFHNFYDQELFQDLDIIPKRLERRSLTDPYSSYETGYPLSHPADPSLMYLYNLIPKDQNDWTDSNPHPEHLEFKKGDRTTVWDWHKNVAAQIGVIHSPSDNKQLWAYLGPQKPYVYVKVWGEVPEPDETAPYTVEKQEAFGKPYSILWIKDDNALRFRIEENLRTAFFAAKPFIVNHKEFWSK